MNSRSDESALKLAPYDRREAEAWNAFNLAARNGHLLFDRGYMDYHADRFDDVSLVASDDEGTVAILPANRRDDIVQSHAGLTFGGLVLGERATTARVLAVFEAVCRHFRDAGATRLVYKAVPPIYHLRPAQEDLYALTRLGARLVRRDVTTTIDLRHRGRRSQRRARGARRAGRDGVSVARSERWSDYWDVLAGTLVARHGVAPTHTLEEITLLAGRFPDRIQLHVATEADTVVAGVVLFETATVAHAQYIAATPRGREIGALDLLFETLIVDAAARTRFFDFGISTTESGRNLNEGLVTQKEEFGGSAVVHDTYELDLLTAGSRDGRDA